MSTPENEHTTENTEPTGVSIIPKQTDEGGKLIVRGEERALQREEQPPEQKKIGLAFQGGGFPAGAVGAGVIQGLAESGLFGPFHGVDPNKKYKNKYDIVAFSGTSAGALLATLCWAWLVKVKCKAKEVSSPTQQNISDDISDLIKVAARHAMYYAYGNNFTLMPILDANSARQVSSLDASLREYQPEIFGIRPLGDLRPYDAFKQLAIAPLLHMLTQHWIEASLAAILHPEADPLDQLFNRAGTVTNTLSPNLRWRPSVPPFDFIFKPDILYKTYGSWLPSVPQLYFWLRAMCYADLWAYNERRDKDPVSELQGLAKQLNKEDLPGLTIASSNIFRGENKSFEADDLLTDGLSVVVASGSLDEVTGWTIIESGKNEGIYLDGAWGDNPPLQAMVNSHKLNEIWVVEFFPKYHSDIPDTPLQRQQRRDQLWQNSLLEHEERALHLKNVHVHRISHNYPTEPKSSLVNNPNFLREMMSYGYAAACGFADNLD